VCLHTIHSINSVHITYNFDNSLAMLKN